MTPIPEAIENKDVSDSKSENVENLSKMVEDNEYLLKCIEQFEKENN